MSRETYGIIHRMTGLMATIQAAVHITITCQKIQFTTKDDTHYHGLLAGCMFLSLLILPLVKRRVYEVFLVTHLSCAFSALFMIWKHIQPRAETSRRYVLICVGSSVVTVRAGERVTLGVPSVGLFYLFQAHPFSITWWEENDEGKASAVFLLFRARTGFTRKVLKCLESDREYWAWIDGPFGPSSVHQCGSTRDLGDYGHVLMVTTGIGIAAQLPYMKELLQRRREAGVRTRRISLVWQLDQTGDYECARDWLQYLLKQDDGYVTQDTRKFGHHELITVYSGKVDWTQVLTEEMQKREGKILVAVSAQRRVRITMQRLYGMSDGMVTGYGQVMTLPPLSLSADIIFTGAMDKTALASRKRSELRAVCRNRLSEHINKTLGINIKPSQVRLRIEDDTQYRWHVNDPRIEELFDKQLSKHSGQPGLPLQEQLDTLRSEHTALIEELEHAKRHVADSNQENERMACEISSLQGKLIEMNTSIAAYQKDIDRWKALAEYYQNGFCQWSDGISQISRFLQNLKAEVPMFPLGYDQSM
ncbi:hypothetical protein EYZ11_009313 [Aspergillus tanneri]|uniref:Ferric reductase NAD binding domain-containing protein n=1 Tax=Aspergillus tanneri TaxID=1220188 RepID=A0A4S3J879_9EURO|nr:hypothetical protein EYZ11_009313 [Aspergillus tanneri]